MKNVNIITKKARRDLLAEMEKDGFINIHGQLEVFASKNGKVFHYDKSDNQVTIWAKHATMHLLTNESYSRYGSQRSFLNAEHTATAVGEGVNNDGTLISGEQYFADNLMSLESRWSKPTDALYGAEGGEHIYPFAPTKMLFGTGFEWNSWADVTGYDTANATDYQTVYAQDYPTSTDFEQNITIAENDYYSGTMNGTGDDLLQTRTMNDIYSASLATPVINDLDWGIRGAVKNGDYEVSSTQRAADFGGSPTDLRTETDAEGREFLLKEYEGIGRPAFIYPSRDNRFFETGTEFGLSADATSSPQIGDIENKITFQVVMPEQTGANANIYYPYNGYILKEAGLFADARLLLGNTVPTPGTREDTLYNLMPEGIMYAKRYISPITKSHDVSITSRWTLYL